MRHSLPLAIALLAGCQTQQFEAESVETRIMLPIIGVTIEREIKGVRHDTAEPEPKEQADPGPCAPPRDWRTEILCRMDAE